LGTLQIGGYFIISEEYLLQAALVDSKLEIQISTFLCDYTHRNVNI